MSQSRLIARLDIKGPNLIKGIQFEGLRVLGDPHKVALKYYIEGCDEILLVDSVASLYGRNTLNGLLMQIAQEIFIPVTVCGGIRSLEDAAYAFRSGADKIAINTAAVKNSEIISRIARVFGSQSVVLSIEAKKVGDDAWEAYVDGGRESTGKNVLVWVQEAIDLGVGEILLTSVDNDGTQKGFDVRLAEKVMSISRVPVIISGGMGKIEHIQKVVSCSSPDGIAVASVLHYKKYSIDEIKTSLGVSKMPEVLL